MKKVALLSIVALPTIVLLVDFSEGTGDFFEILDRTTAEYLMDESDDNNLGKNLHRSSSSAAISAPRNNKYLEASMQIIRGKEV